MKQFLFLTLLLLPTLATAQEAVCDCCIIRASGQNKYDRGDYPGAINSWKNAQTMPDAAAKCTNLNT